MPLKYPLPLPPNSCWLNATGLLPLTSSRRLAPTWDAGGPALLSLLPPGSQRPMPTVGLGWEGSHPCALVPARRAQARST